MKVKKKYVLKQTREKQNNRRLLGDFWRSIYHNEDNWRRWTASIDTVKTAVREREEVSFGTREFNFLTSHIIAIILAPNLKRTGNMALIQFEAARQAIHDAFSAFRRNFPTVKISALPRRLDVAQCVPAVIDVASSMKKNEVETRQI